VTGPGWSELFGLAERHQFTWSDLVGFRRPWSGSPLQLVATPGDDGQQLPSMNRKATPTREWYQHEHALGG